MTKLINCKKKKRICLKELLGKQVWGYFMIGLVVVVGLSYLTFVNKVATDGYQVKALSEKVSELKNKNKKLELESSALQSMQRVSSASQDLNLVAISGIQYVTAGSNAVAAK